MNFDSRPFHKLLTQDEAVEKLFKKSQRLNELPSIREFYAGQEIFITGGSGFMGKVLIEKLLRSCPEIKAIYVLLRPKKGKTIEERLEAITCLQLFQPIRKVTPDVLHKLFPVAGDITELELGLSRDDLNRMKNVSVIFHSAASVRFDDSLKYAVLLNTRGTREVVKFAETLPNLKSVLHVSTTYSNCHKNVIEEKVYEELADWRKTIDICENLDEDMIDIVTQQYTNFMPNTYVFSKNLAEKVVEDYKEKVPLVLFRPSIVISTMREPFPGWVDNFNGPVGILAGSAIGITRTMHCDPNNIADFTPVDVCTKAMIIAAWKRAFEPRCLMSMSPSMTY